MVVGSLDAWLATERGVPAAIPIPKARGGKPNGSATSSASSSLLPLLPEVDVGTSTCDQPVACYGPRLSLLTAKLRDSCSSPRRCGSLSSADDAAYLPRAVSQPELYHGKAVSLLTCDSLSSPYGCGSRTRICSRLADEVAESRRSHHHLQQEQQPLLPSVCRPAASDRLVRSITMSVELSGFAAAAAAAAARTSSAASSASVVALPAHPSHPSPHLPGLQLPDTDCGATSGTASSHASSRNGVFNGTVRGGRPRKAGWCGGEAFAESGWGSRPGAASTSTSGSGPGGTQPPAPDAVHPQPWPQSQSLGDMLHFALHRS